jgi:hypothetical protein
MHDDLLDLLQALDRLMANINPEGEDEILAIYVQQARDAVLQAVEECDES